MRKIRWKGVKSRICRFTSYVLNKRKFAAYHYSDTIIKPMIITPKYIKMGQRVKVRNNARIEGVSCYNDKRFNPMIILHDGVSIEQSIHITCANRIEIGENTAIAAHVTITDIHHPYTDINLPIERQNIEVRSVEIGADCKIYNNVVILPGTKLGKHVTVGANSVVSGVFPDYCVIVGLPAKIVKRYDFEVEKWRHTNKDGVFND